MKTQEIRKFLNDLVDLHPEAAKAIFMALENYPEGGIEAFIPATPRVVVCDHCGATATTLYAADLPPSAKYCGECGNLRLPVPRPVSVLS